MLKGIKGVFVGFRDFCFSLCGVFIGGRVVGRFDHTKCVLNCYCLRGICRFHCPADFFKEFALLLCNCLVIGKEVFDKITSFRYFAVLGEY